jgi:hypothetical protein
MVGVTVLSYVRAMNIKKKNGRRTNKNYIPNYLFTLNESVGKVVFES